MKLIARPKAIIFDWDNTLVDSMHIIDKALEVTFEEYGKDIGVIKQEIYMHKSLKDIFPHIFGDRWQDVTKRFYAHYLHNHLDLLQPLDNALKTLQHLYAQKIKASILSNKHGDVLRKEVKHLGWDSHFIKILGSLDVAEDKPSALPATHLLESMGIDNPQEAWFIGDSMVDMECAANSGCIPIFFGSKSDIYPHSVHNHEELLKLVLY